MRGPKIGYDRTMKPCALALILVLLPTMSDAAGREALFGIWGTSTQCAGEPIKPGGTRPASPFRIDTDWIAHGEIWCRLVWKTDDPRETGVFSSALAQCGEDSVQGYRLDLVLEGDVLRLIWNEALINGPLSRCPTS